MKMKLCGECFDEYERGRFDSALCYHGEEIAHTEGERVIAFNLFFKEAIEKWASSYDLPIEWKE